MFLSANKHKFRAFTVANYNQGPELRTLSLPTNPSVEWKRYVPGMQNVQSTYDDECKYISCSIDVQN